MSRRFETQFAAFEKTEPPVDAAGAEKAARALGMLARTYTQIVQATAATEALQEARRKRRAARRAAVAMAADDDDDGQDSMKDLDGLAGEELERELAELERKMAELTACYGAEGVDAASGPERGTGREAGDPHRSCPGADRVDAVGLAEAA